jgi:hypothetical protein
MVKQGQDDNTRADEEGGSKETGDSEGTNLQQPDKDECLKEDGRDEAADAKVRKHGSGRRGGQQGNGPNPQTLDRTRKRWDTATRQR